jgi:hypothetical protein
VHATQFERPAFDQAVRVITDADAEHKKKNTEVRSQKSEELRPGLDLPAG